MTRRIFIALALLCAFTQGAFAQGVTRVCVQSIGANGSNNCVDVDPSHPFPVSATIGGPVAVSVSTGQLSVFGIYNSTGVSPINGQQVQFQFDQWGKLIVDAGDAVNVPDTPTVQNAAYAAGACLGGFRQITVANYNGQSGFLTGVRVASVGGSTPQIFPYVFAISPTTSTCTDKTAFSLGTADIANLIVNPASNSLTLAAPSNYGTTAAMGSADFTPPKPFKAGGSIGSGLKTIWYGLVTATAITPASVSDIKVNIGAALN